MSEQNPKRIGDDLVISDVHSRGQGAAWLCGTVAGHHFEALMFQEHAVAPTAIAL